MERARTVVLPIVLLLGLQPLVAEEKTNLRDLVNRASAAYAAGDYPECGSLYSRALDQGARFETLPYNAACCHALAGDVDRAFEFLELSVERGWRNVGLLESHSDLESLRGDPRWKAFLQKARAARAAYVASINEELLTMYEEDQGDRSGTIDWSLVNPRDEKRRQRVKELLAAGEVKAAEDHYHAAMVLQHGRTPEDYKLAHELALKAAEMDPEHGAARWLAAAAKDRYLQNIGEPQIYGTQFRKVDGKWTLDPIDETAVTDEERAKWGVPPLATAKKRAEAMNARDGG